MLLVCRWGFDSNIPDTEQGGVVRDDDGEAVVVTKKDDDVMMTGGEDVVVSIEDEDVVVREESEDNDVGDDVMVTADHDGEHVATGDSEEDGPHDEERTEELNPEQNIADDPGLWPENITIKQRDQAWNFVILEARPLGIWCCPFFEGTKAKSQGRKANN